MLLEESVMLISGDRWSSKIKSQASTSNVFLAQQIMVYKQRVMNVVFCLTPEFADRSHAGTITRL